MKHSNRRAGARRGPIVRCGTVRQALALAVLATATVAAGTAHAQDVRMPPAERVDAIFARYDATTTPGCAVAVLHADSVIFRKAYGMAHVGFGVPMTTATTSWIPYSEARTFVALAVAMLARDGALSLDGPVRRHVPEVPAYAADVTVRHLLHHTSGLADYGALDFTFDLTDRVSDDQMFRALERWGRLGFAPGRGHMYSNTDYALLRMLVERVSGRSLHDYLHATLLDRLGMRNTWLGVEQEQVPGAHSMFHGPDWRPVLRYRISPVGRISVTTNVDDLVQWARAVRDSTSGVLALLASLEGGKPDTADTYGLAYGLAHRTVNGLELEEHRGVEGYRYLTRVPSLDLSTERDVVTGAQIGDQLRRYVAVEPTAEMQQSYVGAYDGERVEGTLYVTVDSGRVMLAARGLAPLELAPTTEADVFRVPDYTLRFTRDAAGRVTHLTLDARRVQGMRYARQERGSP